MQKNPPEIRILPEEVANRIAAGEVVERPASALKEMLENSIDAGATRIDIEFRHGGKSFIKIVDDGCAMTRQQALTSLEQHATSKIARADDIFNITSYGFRGEAIPSIASISKFKMRTRPEFQESGTQIEVDAGVVVDVRECGMAAGTQIVVEDIFCSVPARRKFLKSDNVEAGHIIKLCRLYAMALPNLQITLRENSRLIFSTECGLDLMERIRRIYGEELADSLVEMPRVEGKAMSVWGAILKPAESFATSRNISFFINSRPVECRAAYSALKEAYAQLLPKGRYAAAFLFFEIDPHAVDVNVHPAKREVRLKDEFGVRDFLCDSIAECLVKYSVASKKSIAGSPASFSAQPTLSEPLNALSNSSFLRPQIRPDSEPDFAPFDKEISAPRPTPFSDCRAADSDEFGGVEKFSWQSKVNKALPSVRAPSLENPASPEFTPLASGGNNGFAPQKNFSSDWRLIGFFQKKYAIFETEKSMVLMSISSAIKRIDYTRIVSSSAAGAASQKLLIPVNLNFDRSDAECFLANISAFENCGFEIEEFGKNFYRVISAPAWLDFSDVENFVRDFVEIARDESESLKKRSFSMEHFARLAVRRVGGASFECTADNALALLNELLNCPAHLSSPDGKPTLKEFSAAELLRMFAQ